MLEAVCNTCGKTFIPGDSNDTIHLWDEELGRECGGEGTIVTSHGARLENYH